MKKYFIRVKKETQLLLFFGSRLKFGHLGYRSGFTLIELLIVVAIIGILATVVILNVSRASVKARDAKRKSDIVQISKAVRMYHADKGQYPSNNSFTTAFDRTFSISNSSWLWLGGSNYLQPYLASLPKDPKNGSASYYYYRTDKTSGSSVWNWFSVYALALENTNDSQTCLNGQSFSSSYASFSKTYTSCNSSPSLVNAFGMSSDK